MDVYLVYLDMLAEATRSGPIPSPEVCGGGGGGGEQRWMRRLSLKFNFASPFGHKVGFTPFYHNLVKDFNTIIN